MRRRPRLEGRRAGEVAAISAAGVTTVKEEAVQQGEQDIDKVYKFHAILEGATALNIETKAELVELFTKRDRVDFRRKVVPRKFLMPAHRAEGRRHPPHYGSRAFRERERDVSDGEPIDVLGCWTIYN